MTGKCPCQGDTLDRLLQPAILLCLRKRSQNGYQLLQTLSALPMFQAQPPDVTGLYRTLRQLRTRGLLSSHRVHSKTRPVSTVYEVTTEGRACIKRWSITLTHYQSCISALLKLSR